MGNDAKSTVIEEPPARAESAKAEGARAAEKDGAKAAEKKKAQPGPPRSVWREYFESLVVTAIMAFFGMTFVVQAVKVPTGSMQNTITIGDHLLVNKFIFAPGPPLPFLPMRDIRRGDIIVFKYPGSQTSWTGDPNDPTNRPYLNNYVKRVIGLPGDRVELKGTKVVVNGQELPEHIVTAENFNDDPRTLNVLEQNLPLQAESNPPPSGEGAYTVYYGAATRRAAARGETEYPYPIYELTGGQRVITVPADSYFVMGDNRDNSADSRYWGFVPRAVVVGRAMFVYWSYDESKPMQFPYVIDFIRNTRWSRTGTMVK
ncbi:MAG: signal peptidase I [Acidobacteria bacterium]|nr:signal peptidase I [Acidobacteriota bacterium]